MDNRDLLNSLYQIVGDLWGEENKEQDPRQTAVEAAKELPPQEQQETLPAKALEDAPLPLLEKIWLEADEPVEWTAMLAGGDGRYSDEMNGLAASVLHGDTEAYGKALEALKPMEDLLTFAREIQVKAESSDCLQACFQVREHYLTDARYPAALAVRIARDLFAALPVSQVKVTGLHGDAPLVAVALPRRETLRFRFGFEDPQAFVGKYSEEK